MKMSPRFIILIAFGVTVVMAGGNALLGVYSDWISACEAAGMCFWGGVGSLLVGDIARSVGRSRST